MFSQNRPWVLGPWDLGLGCVQIEFPSSADGLGSGAAGCSWLQLQLLMRRHAGGSGSRVSSRGEVRCGQGGCWLLAAAAVIPPDPEARSPEPGARSRLVALPRCLSIGVFQLEIFGGKIEQIPRTFLETFKNLSLARSSFIAWTEIFQKTNGIWSFSPVFCLFVPYLLETL